MIEAEIIVPRMDAKTIVNALLDSGMKQEAIASALDTTQATVSRWLSGSEPKVKAYEKLKALAVEHGLLPEQPARQLENAGKPEKLAMIDEIDVTAGLGGGGLSIVERSGRNGMTFHSEAVRDHWRFPDYVLAQFAAKPAHIKAFPARGDSMSPTIGDGDVVFVDTRHQVPSPPGIYALVDEFGGVIVKRLEVVSRPNDEPVLVRISSDNQLHRERELTLDEIRIIGLCVGRFTRM